MPAAHAGRQAEVLLDTLIEYAREAIADAEAARYPRRSRIELPGLSLDVLGFDGALADAVEQALIPDLQGSIAPRESMRLHLRRPGKDGAPTPLPWGRDPYFPHRISQMLAAAGLRGACFHELDLWYFYDVERRVGVQLMRAADAFPPWEIGAPLRPFLHWHYAERGLRLAHAGTLGVNGRGVLLAGAGGSGKSGTVIGGLLRGLQSVGDDYVLLDAADAVLAYPLFATLKQDPAGFRRLGLPAALAGRAGLNWQGKHQFSIRDLPGAAVPPRLEIVAMLVPRIGAARTAIEPLPRKDAMIALAASSIYQMPGERESGFRFFSRIAQALPCFRLELGADPAEVSDRLAAFVEERR